MIDMQNVKFLNVTPPAAIVDNASWTTTEIDTLGYDYATILFSLGATDIAAVALKVQQSDTSGSGFADISGLDYSSDSDLPTALEDNGIFAFFIDLRDKERYLDVVATAGNGTAGSFADIKCILSRATVTPNTATERGLTDQLFA